MDRKVFYVNSNNGVTAVVPESVYQEIQNRRNIAQEARDIGREVINLPPARPVFTFSDHPALKGFVTGSKKAMRLLLGDAKTELGNIWVPFSNGNQWSGDSDYVEAELLFRTSADEILEHFDLS
ncbi:hypothetical protein K0B04_00030 [Patescibacteria group bacterium]|nr:hypothetical protein [Patescibacteria group bacterium]